jgi:hypothetical protein
MVLQGQAAWLIQEGKKPAGKGYDPYRLSTGGEGRTEPAGQDILLLQVWLIIHSRLTRLYISVTDPVGLTRIPDPGFFPIPEPATSKKRREKITFLTLFVAKNHKNLNYLIFYNRYRQKFEFIGWYRIRDPEKPFPEPEP